MFRLAVRFLGAFVVCLLPVGAATATEPEPEPSIPGDQGAFCAAGITPTNLSQMFDGEPAGVVGADYQRAHDLGDGRYLWTFQDALVRRWGETFALVHNIAMLQDGNCYTVLYRGTRTNPESFLFAEHTALQRRWFWPMGAALDDDGRLNIFVAQMVERSNTGDRGDDYLTKVEPVATHVAVFDPDTNAVVSTPVPADPSPRLHGWSVTTAGDWTYLYANCFRQFGYDEHDEYEDIAAHDRACATRITVGRVPRGRPLATPHYWDGGSWQPDPARAASIVPGAGRIANASQFIAVAGRFYMVNKIDDWWGDRVEIGSSDSPTGPFDIIRVDTPTPKCDVCNTFFASWVPPGAVDAPGRLAYGLAHNRWDGDVSAHYRPTYTTVNVPATPLQAGETIRFRVAQAAAADGHRRLVALNLTVVDAERPGFATVFPCDRPRPATSNLNFDATAAASNMVIVPASERGDVCVYSLVGADVVGDLAGVLATAGADPPSRRFDSRESGRLTAGATIEVDVDAANAIVNLTAIEPDAAGFLTAYPCDQDLPPTSNVNYAPGEVAAGLAVTRTDDDGRLCVYSSAATHLAVDVYGELPMADTAFVPETNPTRLVDTRDGDRVGAGTFEVLPVGAPGRIAALNLTAVEPDDAGYLTAYPCSAPRPTASNVNFTSGEAAIANMALVRADEFGNVCVFSRAGTDLVVDRLGWYESGSPSIAPESTPRRIIDTRAVAALDRLTQ